MKNFVLENVLFGAETPIKEIGLGVYDTDLELPTINEGDEAYFITATLFLNNEILGRFERTVKIVSLNSMTGFEVDEQRNNFIDDFINNLNK